MMYWKILSDLFHAQDGSHGLAQQSSQSQTCGILALSVCHLISMLHRLHIVVDQSGFSWPRAAVIASFNE